jgi:hypothetical protein
MCQLWGISQYNSQIAYLDKTANEAQRKTVAQNRLDEDTQSENMNPSHDSITVASATKTKSLAPNTALVLFKLLLLTFFCFASTFGEFPLTGRPAPLAHLVDKLCTVLLEDGDGEQAELVILGQLLRRAGYDHGAQRLVALQVVLDLVLGHGDQMLLQVFRGVWCEEVVGVDDRGQRLLRQVAGARAQSRSQRGLCSVVLVELGLDVVVYAGNVLQLLVLADATMRTKRQDTNLLEHVDQLGDGLVGAVLDLVPLEGLQVVVDGLVVDVLLVGHLVLVALEDVLQRVGHLLDDTLASLFQLLQIVGLLHQRVQSANLERRQVEGIRRAVVRRHDRSQSRQGFVAIIRRRDGCR